MNTDIIKLKNVFVLSLDGFTILKDINISVPAGKTSVIMGLSGSGKSTLLKVMAGLCEISEGEVIYKGRNISRLSHTKLLKTMRNTAFVFQDAALWANMSLYQNLTLPYSFSSKNTEKEDIDKKIEKLCNEFLFDDDLVLRPAQISIGERKIISFMRAILQEPKILFMDEPTSSVDAAVSERIINYLRNYKNKATMVISTNDPAICSKLADFLIVLKEGRIVETGDFDTVIRSDNPDTIEALSDVLSLASTYDKDILSMLGDDIDD
ncbi:ATP-binding cassette domain-containing protein [Spirochaetia bacterium 38H-sp]|uniref:ATP-binding cassette domain-containing protein n=1 Tax=Rarispira pelagica TaxID=3141764 RepID=A0ABU9UAX5_9SPIR